MAMQAEATGTSKYISAAAAEPVHCGSDSRRRRRVLFSREQTVALEECFARHSYVSPVDRDRLAASLALRPTQVRRLIHTAASYPTEECDPPSCRCRRPTQVKVWFQNRRYKLKKMRQQNLRQRDQHGWMMMTSSSVTSAQFHDIEAEDARCGRDDAQQQQPSLTVRRIAVPILFHDGLSW